MSKNLSKTADNTAYINDIPKTPVRFILHVAKSFKWLAFGAIVPVIFASGLGQSTSYFFKLIIDASESGDTQSVVFFALLYPTALFVVHCLYRVSGIFANIWIPGIAKHINDMLVKYLLNHSHGYFSNRFSGSLLSKVNNVVGAVDKFLPDLLWTHLTALVSFCVTTVFILRADLTSGFLFLVLVAVLLITNRFFAPKKKILSYKYSALGTKLRGTVVDILTNISATRQYVRIEDEIERVKVVSEEHRLSARKSYNFTEIMLLLNTFILFIFTLSIFYFLVGRWSSGEISTGDFVFILALYSQIMGTLLFIGRAFNNTARSFGEIEEGLNEILIPYEINDNVDSQSLKVEKGEVKWNEVTFEYGANKVFDNFSLTIPDGQRVGLVGTSGAGKTTFVSLMLRQHDLTAGSITIDGQNIAEVTQDSLRKHIAVVPQEPLLFHRSIRDNIAYGNPKATMEEIIEVAKKAQAHDFIATLPEGYETLVGERGVKLSGGQKQRVAIARAMLKDAPLLILDEATSALDSESEVAIQKALHELMVGKTVVAIAHRLSTLREMDRIIVLEKGKIVEDGTHEELTKAGGTYARLWEHQAGGFLLE